ncbi:heavy metal-associated isoprenylated plant protein 43-like [Tripterygium wilfordii]|uniref:heavy metal-associated isoprenylated plant protein 43-like n=1 Tax=Tripterygium wilfordii TaxID=458696 RepID=UPI0018F821BB|nr:heavy metal-associated isoprenylated plant protein 43-like [Tripterygium wilfordii]
MKKTVIKVNINCQICKTEALKAVTKLSGIDQISVDGEKQTLTVIGEVDPVKVIKQLRKVGRIAHIVSVGPPETPKPKPPDDPVIPPPPLPPYCNGCQLVPVGYIDDPYNHSVCVIL